MNNLISGGIKKSEYLERSNLDVKPMPFNWFHVFWQMVFDP